MTIIIVLLVILLFVGIPNWHGYGYGPSGIIGLLVVVLLILLLLGYL
jgi:uncharacterized membrane protein YkvI